MGTLVAFNNEQFVHLKLLVYMSRFSQPLKRTCTFSLEGNGSKKAIQKSHRVGSCAYFVLWVNNFNWFNHKRITGKLHWFPNPWCEHQNILTKLHAISLYELKKYQYLIISPTKRWQFKLFSKLNSVMWYYFMSSTWSYFIAFIRLKRIKAINLVEWLSC